MFSCSSTHQLADLLMQSNLQLEMHNRNSLRGTMHVPYNKALARYELPAARQSFVQYMVHCIRLTASWARDMDRSKQDLQATPHSVGPLPLLQPPSELTMRSNLEDTST